MISICAKLFRPYIRRGLDQIFFFKGLFIATSINNYDYIWYVIAFNKGKNSEPERCKLKDWAWPLKFVCFIETNQQVLSFGVGLVVKPGACVHNYG